MVTYKIITASPFDMGASTVYWIEKKTSIFFGWFSKTEILGDYKFDDTFGELGDCPFFSKKIGRAHV